LSPISVWISLKLYDKPSSVTTFSTVTIPVVPFVLSVIKSKSVALRVLLVLSVIVTAISSGPWIPEVSNASFTSEAVPVNVVASMVTTAVIPAFIVFKVTAAMVVSVRVTATPNVSTAERLSCTLIAVSVIVYVPVPEASIAWETENTTFV